METNITYKIKCLKGKYSGQVIPVKVGIDDVEEIGLSSKLVHLGLFDFITGDRTFYYEVLEREISHE